MLKYIEISKYIDGRQDVYYCIYDEEKDIIQPFALKSDRDYKIYWAIKNDYIEFVEYMFISPLYYEKKFEEGFFKDDFEAIRDGFFTGFIDETNGHIYTLFNSSMYNGDSMFLSESRKGHIKIIKYENILFRFYSNNCLFFNPSCIKIIQKTNNYMVTNEEIECINNIKFNNDSYRNFSIITSKLYTGKSNFKSTNQYNRKNQDYKSIYCSFYGDKTGVYVKLKNYILFYYKQYGNYYPTMFILEEHTDNYDEFNKDDIISYKSSYLKTKNFVIERDLRVFNEDLILNKERNTPIIISNKPRKKYILTPSIKKAIIKKQLIIKQKQEEMEKIVIERLQLANTLKSKIQSVTPFNKFKVNR